MNLILINQNHQIRRSKLLKILIKSLTTCSNYATKNLPNCEFSSTQIDPYEIFASFNNSRLYTIKDAKFIHAHLIKMDTLHSDVFLTNSLIDWYFKLSAIDYAHKVFDEMPSPNFVSWNVMISGYNNNLLYGDAWGLFRDMRVLGYGSNQHAYGSVVTACGGLGSLLYGKLICGLTLKDGFFSNGYVRSGLIDLFAKNGKFEDAIKVFDDWPFEENVVCWNSIISGAVKSRNYGSAIELFERMRHCSVFPNSFTFSGVLTACTAIEDDSMGKKVHGLVIKHGAGEDVFVGSNISDLYSKCGDMEAATKNFLRMPAQNVVSWTTMISGYVQKGDVVSALKLFGEMRKVGIEVNKYTITSILSACAKSHMINVAMQMHSWIIKAGLLSDSCVRAALVNMYSKMGEVYLSEMIYLEHGYSEDASVLTVMISLFAKSNRLEKATTLLRKMLLKGMKPDSFSISSVLSVVDSVNLGKQIHTYVLRTGLAFDVNIGCSLFTMYSKCGHLLESYEVFRQIPEKDTVSWTSMIFGFAEHGHSYKAIQLFKEMLSVESRPDQTTLVGVLTACTYQGTPQIGKEIHGYAFRVGISKESSIGGALVNMYAKWGALDLARRVYDMIPHKDQIMCSALVSGYAKNGNIEEALCVLRKMLLTNIELDSYMVSSIIGCDVVKTGIGIQLHALVMKLGLQSYVAVGSALIAMYSRKGAINDSRRSFDQIIDPDLIGWTTMIVSYSQHGKGVEALELFDNMISVGVKPDSVTFGAVLSACSHAGLVEEGYHHLNSMSNIYEIEPKLHHYACMVDLLGRSGRLKEAVCLIENMPIAPDSVIWGTLLAACKIHGDVEIGRLAAEKVFELGPSDSGAYVSLSNICADLGQWEDVEEIRSQMKGTKLSKEPAWSHA